MDVVKARVLLSTNDAAKARLELIFKSQPGELSQDRVLLDHGDLIKTGTDGVHCDSRVGNCDFGFFVQGYGASCVKSDGIPDKLKLLFGDTAILQKRARRIRAVNLKSVLRSVAVGQSQIVQNCR